MHNAELAAWQAAGGKIKLSWAEKRYVKDLENGLQPKEAEAPNAPETQDVDDEDLEANQPLRL